MTRSKLKTYLQKARAKIKADADNARQLEEARAKTLSRLSVFTLADFVKLTGIRPGPSGQYGQYIISRNGIGIRPSDDDEEEIAGSTLRFPCTPAELVAFCKSTRGVFDPERPAALGIPDIQLPSVFIHEVLARDQEGPETPNPSTPSKKGKMRDRNARLQAAALKMEAEIYAKGAVPKRVAIAADLATEFGMTAVTVERLIRLKGKK